MKKFIFKYNFLFYFIFNLIFNFEFDSKQEYIIYIKYYIIILL